MPQLMLELELSNSSLMGRKKYFVSIPDMNRDHPQWKSMLTIITGSHYTNHDHHGEESKAPKQGK